MVIIESAQMFYVSLHLIFIINQFIRVDNIMNTKCKNVPLNSRFKHTNLVNYFLNNHLLYLVQTCAIMVVSQLETIVCYC